MFGSVIGVIGLTGTPERGRVEVGIGCHASLVTGHPLPATGGFITGVGLLEADPLVGLVTQSVEPAGDPQFVQVGDPGEIAGLACVSCRRGIGHRGGPGAGGGIDLIIVATAGAIGNIGILEQHCIAGIAVG